MLKKHYMENPVVIFCLTYTASASHVHDPLDRHPTCDNDHIHNVTATVLLT